MKLVKEHISFERGKDPKEVLGIGDPFFQHAITEEVKKIMEEFNGSNFELEVDTIHGEVACFFHINNLQFYISFSKNAILRFTTGFFGWGKGWGKSNFSNETSNYFNESKRTDSLKGAIKILKTYLKIQTKY